MIRHLILLVALSSWVAPILPAYSLQTHGNRCKPKKVDQWKAVGTRWAEGFDVDGNLVGIYDLSYTKAIGRRKLGRFLPADRFSKVDEIAETEHSVESLAADWWKSVPWTGKQLAIAAPTTFSLSQIETKLSHEDKKAIEAELTEMQGEETKLGDFMEQFRFEANPDGSYNVHFVPSEKFKIGSIKVMAEVDCYSRRKHLGLSRIISKRLLKFIASEAAEGTVLGSLLSSSISFYFRYQGLNASYHRHLLLEMLEASANGEKFGDSPAPFSDLTEEQRTRAAMSILLDESSGIVGTLTWLFKHPKNEWLKQLSQNAVDEEYSIQYMLNQGETFEELNPRFAIRTDEKGLDDSLLILARSKSSARGPIKAVDFQNPDAIQKFRIRREIRSQTVDVASRMIPMFGFFIRQSYRRIVDSPMRSAQRWEARLTAHLEERARVIPGESKRWDQALDILDRQNVNPFVLSRKKALEIARARREALGI